MENLKKIWYFLIICFSVLGALGGFGYAIYGGSWPIAIGIIPLTYCAMPKIMEYADKIID